MVRDINSDRRSELERDIREIERKEDEFDKSLAMPATFLGQNTACSNEKSV